MEKCLSQPAAASVLHIDGNSVKFNTETEVKDAHFKGIISDLAFARYNEVYVDPETFDKKPRESNITGDQVSKEEKKFIEFITDFIVTSNPGSFSQTVTKIDDKIKKLPATDPINMYRKKFGSLDKCLKQPGIASVMHIEGNTVKFNSSEDITEAHTNGVLTDLAYAKYQEDLIDQKYKGNSKQVKKDTGLVYKDSKSKDKAKKEVSKEEKNFI